MNISGNTIFIPGSTSGIGLALAVALQARGNTVIIGGRRADLLAQIAAEHPGLDTRRDRHRGPGQHRGGRPRGAGPAPGPQRPGHHGGHHARRGLAPARVLPGLGRVGRDHQRARPDPADRGVHRAPAGPAGRHDHDGVLGPGVRAAAGDAELQRVEGRDPHAQRVAAAAARRHQRQGRRAGAAVGPHRAAARAGATASSRCRWTSSWPRSWTLLEAQPEATEIQVERVKFLRYGEARGDYDQVVATLNAADPHGS